jgi:hypothetical protein
MPTDLAPDPTRRSKIAAKGAAWGKYRSKPEEKLERGGRRLGLGHQVNNEHPGLREVPHNGEVVKEGRRGTGTRALDK